MKVNLAVFIYWEISFVSRWPLIVGKLSDLGERFWIRGQEGAST